LDAQIGSEEAYGIVPVGADPAYLCGAINDGVGPVFLEEMAGVLLYGQVECGRNYFVIVDEASHTCAA
jgi:hypothetical protein